MYSVLITDDESAVRKSIRYLSHFRELGISEIYEARTGSEAIEIIDNHNIDILLTDIEMPDRNGVGLMTWVKKRHPNIKIIVISAYQNFDYILQAMRNGAMDYLLKPIEPERLNKLLSDAIKAIKESSPSAPSSWSENENFISLKNYISEHFKEDLTLNNLAGKFGFNPSYLSRKFKSTYGIGINEYLTEVRIKRAKEILEATDIKIYEIAKMVGYQDEKYFSRVFSLKTGKSPIIWRIDSQKN